MTLHGASGTNDDDLRRAILAGITEIHINTEVRLAWRRALESEFTKEPNQVVPYKLLAAAVDAMKQVISSRLLLFNGRFYGLATLFSEIISSEISRSKMS